MKEKGHNVNLLLNYNNLNDYNEVYISKVFSFSAVPIDLSQYKHIKIGGTGFFEDGGENLPYEIEHHMPDYHLYDEYIQKEIDRGINPSKFKDYQDYSVGFATRGCFRKCSFCVNKKYKKAQRHAYIKEFYDQSRKYIYLWDDNILAYSKWFKVFDELAEINKPFQFRQGMDIRLMTEEKAKIISQSKYKGDYIFAFDHIDDKDLIESKIKLWKSHCTKTTKLYVLCAFESQDEMDIVNTFERIKILMNYGCLPYIMRYSSFKNSRHRGMYINLARWCNQPNFFKKKSFREFCEINGENSSTMRYMNDFQKEYPDIAKRYFDLKFEDLNKYKK